jgi:hypothetical protein
LFYCFSLNIHFIFFPLTYTQALWNFAYLESNRKLIAESEGLARLARAMEQTDDEIVKKNIYGVLRMFTAPPEDAKPDEKGYCNSTFF